MRTVILITNHYLHSKRRAGFHWIADALHRQGWRVIFMTAPLSWVSWLRRDHRLAYDVRREAGGLRWSDDRLASYVWWTPFHPVRLRPNIVNRLTQPLVDRFERFPLGAIEAEVRGAECFIFESSAALGLAERFHALNPRARRAYRVSDDLRTLRVHPSLHEREIVLSPRFDVVSSPTSTIHAKFAHLPNAKLHPHGVPTHLFEQCHTSPYPDDACANLVFTGVARLDQWFIDAVSAARPDVRLHIIGPFRPDPRRSNVHFHGEMGFEQIVPFVKFANAGLQTITSGPGAESFADSLKVMHYCWCGLPIIVPEFLRGARPNFVDYTHGDERSALAAVDRALAMSNSEEWRKGITSWDGVAQALVGDTTADTHGSRSPAAVAR